MNSLISEIKYYCRGLRTFTFCFKKEIIAYYADPTL